ncbi:MAG: hypothetical protein GY756_19630, partial [bacterium]|nr:hypothetical protein [bacterium]
LENSIFEFEKPDFIMNPYSVMFSIIFLIIGIGFLFLSIFFAKGNIRALFYPPDLIVVVFSIIGAMLISRLHIPFFKGLSYAFSDDYHIGDNEKLVIVNTFNLLIKVSFVSGLVGFIINLILLMVDLNNFELIIYRIATIMMPVFWGIIIGFLLLFPIKKRIILKSEFNPE